MAIRHTLWFRLTAAFLLVAVVGVVVVALLANQATAVGFHAYLQEAQWSDLRTDLTNLYEQQGNWEGAELLLTAVRPGRGQGGGSLVLLDENGIEVAAAGGRGARPTSAANADTAIDLVVNDRTVGTLLVKEPGGEGAQTDDKFLTEVNRAVWLGGAASVLLALLLGIILARRLARPLTKLTHATQQMAQGDLAQQVTIRSQGEMGQLAASFNQMAGALAHAEEQRQQLLADVAHELRTPLSIMRGHVEAMLDGVFDISPDNLALVHEETLLLGRLVEDLRTLSLAENNELPLNLRQVDLWPVAQQAVNAFEPLAESEGIQLTIGPRPTPSPLIMADPDRLQQVLGNLIANALRHVVRGEAKPHTVQLRLAVQGNAVQAFVADNGPGLSPEAQAHVFDRFWRAEGSRTRDQGGSGLGLAICRAIISAHNGRIWVQDTPGGGATFAFELTMNN
ncbi:MAG: HAMP domain-containing protein [Ardenticatenaceae bacterium]|nr:HAMP domain-containing protein [Ardenticatenaceae bacterium]